MSERPEKITEENVLTVDIPSIAHDRRFAELKFENAQKKLPKIQKWLIEGNELGAKELLNAEDLNSLKNLTKDLVQHLENLLTFEIRTTNDTASNEHQNIESRIESFYNSAYQKLPKDILPFLRQETARATSDVKELERSQKEAIKTKKEYEGYLEELKKQLGELGKRQQEISSKKGEIAAITFGNHFEQAATDYKVIAEDRWFSIGKWSFIALLAVVSVNIIVYLVMFVGEKLIWWSLKPTDFFTLEYALVKLALLLLLSYLVGFSSRQYSINSHLAASNNHRKNIAETMRYFYESDIGDSAKTAIVDRGTEAMFKNLPIGHISKSEGRDSEGPIHQVINQFSKIID